MKRKKNEEAVLPMSSMIDVVFLLLIFFIWVHSDVSKEARLAINLPMPGAAAASQEVGDVMLVYVQAGGVLALNTPENVISVPDLKRVFAEAAYFNNQQSVLIQPTPDADFGTAVEVLDITKRPGYVLQNVSLLDSQ